MDVGGEDREELRMIFSGLIVFFIGSLGMFFVELENRRRNSFVLGLRVER